MSVHQSQNLYPCILQYHRDLKVYIITNWTTLTSRLQDPHPCVFRRDLLLIHHARTCLTGSEVSYSVPTGHRRYRDHKRRTHTHQTGVSASDFVIFYSSRNLGHKLHTRIRVASVEVSVLTHVPTFSTTEVGTLSRVDEEEPPPPPCGCRGRVAKNLP